MAGSLPVSTSCNLSSSSISLGSESDQQLRTFLTRSMSNACSIDNKGTSNRSEQVSGKKGECPESDQETGAVKKVYASKRIIEKAFVMLDEFRRQSLLCDVIIRVDDNDFSSHKVVLAATSPYFQAMFTSELSESRQEVITLKEVDPVAIEQLINFMYTGGIEVGEENVQSLLPAANLLQLNEVRDSCCDFLKDQLHPSNCLGIKTFADIHSCLDLFGEAQSYAQKHFSKVMETEEFYNLTHSNVIELISSTELGILSEEDVFEAVINWTKHNEEERAVFLPELLSHVRFLFLRREYLVSRVCEEKLIQSNPLCKDFLIDALKYHVMPNTDKASQAMVHCLPRKRIGSPQSILTIGGQAPKAIRSVEIYDISNRSCHPGPELISRRCRCGVTTLNNSVYAVGGFDGTSRIRSVERLDIVLERWVPVEPMLSRRSTLGVAVLHGELYAVGGFDGNNGLDTVEKYNPETKQWTSVAGMTTRRSSVGVAVMNGLLYAVGGYDGVARQCLNSVEVYNSETNDWSQVEPMIQRRSGAAVAVIDNLLYAIGGHDGPDIRKSVECYDSRTGKWSRIPDMFTCRRNAAATVVYNLLYVVGGDDGVSNLSSMEVYDPIFKVWKIAHENLSLGRSYAGVAVVDKSAKMLSSISQSTKLPDK